MLGLNLSQRSPWAVIPFLAYATKLRNKVTNEHIKTLHVHDADPLAEDARETVLKRPRREFVEGVPHTIALAFPALGLLKATAMNVRTCAKANNFEVELTPSNLDYLARAVHVTWPHNAPSDSTSRRRMSCNVG